MQPNTFQNLKQQKLLTLLRKKKKLSSMIGAEMSSIKSMPQIPQSKESQNSKNASQKKNSPSLIQMAREGVAQLKAKGLPLPD